MNVDWLTSLDLARALFGGALIVIVLVMALIDCCKMILPDWLNVILAATGLSQAVVIAKPGLIDAALGALFALALMWTVAALFRRYRGIDGLGFGDVKFSAAAGFWLGWEGVAPMLLVASCSALLFVVLASWRQRKVERTARLPFGPFLAFGTAVCWLLAALPQSLA